LKVQCVTRALKLDLDLTYFCSASYFLFVKKEDFARTQKILATKNYTPHLFRFGVVAGFIMSLSAMAPTRPGAAAILTTANPAPGKYEI